MHFSAEERPIMRRLVLGLIVLIIAAAGPVRAGSDDSVTLRSTDGQYQLVLAKGWEAKDFHVDAVQIGAENKHIGEYVEVIVENISDYTDSLVQYAEAKRDMIALSLDNPRLTPGQSVQVNSLPGIRYEIHGQLPGSDISIAYVLTIMKTKSHYIQIVDWTKESRFSANQSDLEQIAGKFSETGAGQN
jgi:hypothetical protein